MKRPNQIRLDKIEIQLSPKEWAIRLVDEVRRYPNELEFERATAKTPYRELPGIKPLFALQAQADDLYPRKRPIDRIAWQKCADDLRGEFQALKSLINDVNQESEIKTERIRLKTSVLAGQLYQLIEEDTFAKTSEATAAWIGRHRAADAEDAERQSILDELANAAGAAGSGPFLFSRAGDWADDAALLLTELFMRKAAVQAVQKKYFDNHAILGRSIEGAVETTTQQVLEAVALFNEYVKTKAGGWSQDSEQRASSQDATRTAAEGTQEASPWSSLYIDVEAIRIHASKILPGAMVSYWEHWARTRGIADILRVTGEHESVFWERFRERELNRLAQRGNL